MLVSAGFLTLAFRKVDWGGVWQVIQHADGWLLLAALATVLVTTLIRAERWRELCLPNRRPLRLSKFAAIFLIGQMINALTPARLGELARAYLIGEVERVGKAHAFWATVVEKVLDSLVLLIVLTGVSLWVPLPDWLRSAGRTLSLGVGGVFALVALAIARRAWAARQLARLEAALPWARHLRLPRLLAAVADTAQIARRPALWGGVLAWSIAAFLLGATTNWLTGLALGLRLPYAASLLLLAVLQITAVVPIPTSPGRVGLFHYLCIVTLAIYGVERDAALGFGLVLHLLTYLPMAVGGPICLWLENYDLRGLRASLPRE